MPSHLKELVRARMEKTGEGYQQALRHVRAQEERAAEVPSRRPEEAVVRSRTVADTAFSIAVVRAEEGRRPDGEQLFVDPYASAFAAAGVHVADSTRSASSNCRSSATGSGSAHGSSTTACATALQPDWIRSCCSVRASTRAGFA